MLTGDAADVGVTLMMIRLLLLILIGEKVRPDGDEVRCGLMERDDGVRWRRVDGCGGVRWRVAEGGGVW